MLTRKVLTCGKVPLSAARISEHLDGVFVKLRQQIDEMVDLLGSGGVSASGFQTFTAGLRAASAASALEALVAVVEAADPVTSTVEEDGRELRFRGSAEKQWLTPFGLATVRRRYYAGEDRGDYMVPLDAMLGMTDRYMTPEVEEMVAFASSAMTPCEVEQIMSKTLPVAPSATAIKRTIRDVGEFFETNKVFVEERIAAISPLSREGANLVVSWDGVMVPLRGEGETAWKEAGVGRVSIYSAPRQEDGKPSVIDNRYFARMPESDMPTLIAEVAACVADVTAQRKFDHVAVICDGKDSIWNAAKKRGEFDGAVFILDFYHASQTLSAVADAIFGQGDSARRWYDARRERLMLDEDAILKLLRTLRRYEKDLRSGSDEHAVVRRALKHFKKNRHRMRYAEFIAMGLPIGSGHIESAAKNIVQARLKRSGMRWSIAGGQQILNIRTRVKDGRWNAAWGAYMTLRKVA